MIAYSCNLTYNSLSGFNFYAQFSPFPSKWKFLFFHVIAGASAIIFHFQASAVFIQALIRFTNLNRGKQRKFGNITVCLLFEDLVVFNDFIKLLLGQCDSENTKTFFKK